jgi:hypothetical protein
MQLSSPQTPLDSLLMSFVFFIPGVSATYLSMVLSQAEEEGTLAISFIPTLDIDYLFALHLDFLVGYSVFVVRPLDPSANKSTNTSDLSSSPAQAASFLPPCSADERASRLGSPSNTPLTAPVGAWGREAQSASFGEFDGRSISSSTCQTAHSLLIICVLFEFADDADLQAALAASMADEPSQTDQSNTSPADHSSTQATPSPNDESDPVAASLRRAQARLQAFQREQTEALMGGGGYDGYGYGQGASYGGAGAAAGVGSSGEAGETRNLSASRGGASSAAGRGQESPPRSRRRQADPSPTVPNPANRHNIPSSFSSSIDARDPNPVPLPRSSSSRNSRATSSNPTLPAAPAPSVDSHPAPSSRSKRTRHDEDEEMLRKAIAASVREQEKRDRQAARSAGDRNAMDEDSDVELDDDEGDAEFDEDYDDIFNNPTPPSDQRPTTSRTPPYASHTPSPPYPAGVAGDRDYNDEDEELQRALAASLESIPQGWEGIKVDSPVRAPSTAAPSLPRADASVRSVASAAGIPPPGGAVVEAVGASVQRGQEQDEEMGGESDSVGGDETGTTEVEQAESLSPGEIRRRRLARFG